MSAEIERGWSSGGHRQLWRFLARNLPGRNLSLPARGTVASFTFDDVPENAVTIGAPLLERHGARGTFYVATGLCGRPDALWRMADRAQIRDLAQAGHEIGCHTARHVNVQSLGAAELVAECEKSRGLIEEIAGQAPRNFCYPFGDVGFRQRRILAERFDTCRTIYEHHNAGRIDPAMLGAYGLFDAVLDRPRLAALVDAAVARGGWLVFYTHDVSPEPTRIGASPALIEAALAILAERGVPVLSIAQAVRHFRAKPEG